MATNLRLSERAAAAVREASLRSGKSQQEILREAVDRYLGLTTEANARDRAVASGLVKPPSPFVDVTPTITLPPGRTTLELLDRDER